MVVAAVVSPMSRVVAPAAIPVVDRLAGLCIERTFDMLTRRGPTQALARQFLKGKDISDLQPWRSLLDANTPGTLDPAIPVFLAQGSTDKLVLPAVTRDYMRKLCRAGSAVAYDLLPGVGHGFSGRDSAEAAVAWMADRFDGKPAPTSCGGR
jgi:acetyl esterase/lipase